VAEFAVAVGSNRGDRIASIAEAGRLLCVGGDIQIRQRSPLIATAPVGGPAGQGDFLNGAWIVESALGAHQLLHRLQAVEHALGRVRTVVWGPRTIDLDLVLAREPLVFANPVLHLPHPRLAERRFVLEPLAVIAGDWWHPLEHCRVADLLARCS
jgi:2-amino-4-hydroxy-6-hydroxymethyldihydropteridine diphosphokinase